MKKVLFIASILFVAVISTACINNLAVQDLNNKAQGYMAKGDYPQAIERLKSSIDLDPSIFETHYNLAVAYTQNEDYVNAVEEYKKAIKIRPQSAVVYYSLATAENNLMVDMEQGKVRMNDIDNSLYSPKTDEEMSEKVKLTAKEKEFVSELNDSAIQNYQQYLKLNPKAKDKKDVELQIQKMSEPQDNQQQVVE